MNQMVRVAIFINEGEMSSNFHDLLSQTKQFNYIGKFTNRKELLSNIRNYMIDVLLIDGVSILRESKLLMQIKSLNEKLKMIGIIEDESNIEVDKILKEEIQGYLLAPHKLETIVQAIQVCSLGGIYLSENVKGKFFNTLSEKYLNIYEMNLSPREKQIATLYCEGFSYKEIAKKLCISPQTVKTHLKNFHNKFKNNYTDQLTVKNIHRVLKVKRNKNS